MVGERKMMSRKMTLKETLKKIAFETWFLLSDARETGMPIGEETITETNLLKLRLANHPEITIHAFSKREESRNGADWEWWLTGKSGKWRGLRMQAKKLDLKTNCFEELHYKQGEQTDNLITHCESESPSPIPLYCLYLITESQCCIETSLCQACKSAPAESFGCSLASAYFVRQLGAKNHLSDLLGHIVPWHCMFHGVGIDDEEMLQWVSFIGHLLQDVEDNNIPKLNTLYDSPPAYVEAIRKNNKAAIKPPDEDLAGFIIVDTSGREK